MKSTQLILVLWLSLIVTLNVLQTTHSQNLTPQNVASGKLTFSSSGNDVRYGSNAAVVDGNRSASLNYTDCTGCFATQRDQFGWWRVDLGEPYFVTSVHIYVPSDPEGSAAVLSTGTTLTLISNGPVIIDESDTGAYSNYLQIGYSFPPDYPSSSDTTLTTQTLSSVRYAQYVSLVTNSETAGLRLAEVEVYGYSASVFIPRDITAGSANVTSVMLSWKSPLDEQIVVKYEYGCSTGVIIYSEQINSAEINLNTRVEGLNPDTSYFCNVRVKDNNGGATRAQTIQTKCDAPSPQSVSFGTPAIVTHDGRRRWRYTVTWQPPSGYSSSCLHSTNPYKLRVDGVDMESHQSNSYTYYADGNLPASISVWTRNKHGVLSQNPAVGSITTAQGLRPQLVPRNLELTSPNYECVQLSWDPPQYPNAGHQTTVTYQYKCTTMSSWQTVPSNNRRCGYSGYQDVSCQLRVRNRFSNVNRYSDAATSNTIRTMCHNPGRVTNITLTRSQVTHSNRLRWRYTAMWQDPPTSQIHCARIRTSNPYQVSINNGVWTYLSSKTFQFYEDGYTGGLIMARVYNNENFASDDFLHTFTTDKLAPQTSPQNSRLSAHSAYCASYSWDPPQYLNSPPSEVYYQVNCNSRGWETKLESDTTCSFDPYQYVTCALRAVNTVGVSLNATNSKRTLCAAPSVPRNVRITALQVVYHGAQYRYQRQCNVSWETPNTPNCASLRAQNRYQIYYAGTWRWTTYNRLNYTIHADGDIEIEVRVRAYNNEHMESPSVVRTLTTAPSRPQTKPNNFTLVSNSYDCVFLSWTPPTYPNGRITTYQYNCTNANAWVGAGGNMAHTASRCNYLPYTEVTCEIRAQNSEGFSDMDTKTTRTLCAAPTLPRSVRFENLGIESNNGRDRRKYRVRWGVPERVNCHSLKTTNRYSFKDPSGQVYNTNNNQYIIYTEGDVDISVEVTATNNENFVSSAARDTLLTETLRPQKAPVTFDLAAYTPHCVRMTWTPPQHPNGEITSYGYKCTRDIDWVNVTGGSVRARNRCGYDPYAEVSCQLRARNIKGVSDVSTTGSIRTYCDRPTVPRNITFIFDKEWVHSGRQRVRYVVTWQAPESHNCQGFRSANAYRINSTSLTQAVHRTSGSRSINVNADGVEPITVTVEAYNNHDNKSDIVTASIISRALRPQTTPRNFRLTSPTFNCVNLTWMEPQYPNGDISHYQYKCTGNDNWINVSYPLMTKNLCIYGAYTPVTCEIKATNQIGDSDIATESTRTLCTYPDLPDNLTDYILEDIDKSGKPHRRRIKFHLPKPDVTPNCANIPNSGIKFGMIEGEPTANQGQITDLAAVTEYQIVVTVRNNEDFITNKTITYTTGELAPYDEPRMILDTNSSCVLVILREPNEPNGIITHYEYGCGYFGEVNSSAPSERVTAAELHGRYIPTFCGFKSASIVQCQAIAVNSMGSSPVATKRITVDVEVNYNRTMVINKVTAGGVEIILFPAYVDSDLANISSYLVVVSQESNRAERQRRSLPLDCDLYDLRSAQARQEDCYITGLLHPNDIESEGTLFTIGNGKYSRGYYNEPLVDGDTYTVHIVIKGFTQDGSEFIQIVESNTISVTSKRCPEPPQVDNANLVSPTVSQIIGSQLLYQCDGSVASSGNGVYVCEDVGGKTMWSGELSCSGKANTNIVVGLVVPFVLVFAILLAVMLYWKRRQLHRGTPKVPEHTNNSQKVLSVDEVEVDAAEYATIIELRDSLSTRAEYDQVADFRSPRDEYEQVANIRSNKSSQPVYENRSGSDQQNNQHYEELQRKKESHIYDAA